MRLQKLLIFLVFLSFCSIAFSETTGTLNFSTRNYSISTGIFGYTVGTCTSSSQCLGYVCIYDFDNSTSSYGSYWDTFGVCTPSTNTSCIHDDTSTFVVVPSGSLYCVTNTTTRTCTSRVWTSTSSSCASGQVCTVGAIGTTLCGTSSSTTTNPGSGTGTAQNSTSANKGLINISLSTSTLRITQGQSAVFTATIRNSGNASLVNITLSLSGIDGSWFSIQPTKITSILIGNTNLFSVNVTVPTSAEVKGYSVSCTAAAPGVTQKSASLVLSILPSSSSISGINESYYNYTLAYAELENNVTSLEGKVNQTDLASLRSLLTEVQNRLSSANTSMLEGNYFAAQQFINEAKNLMSTLAAQISQVSYVSNQSVLPGFDNSIVFIIAGVVIVAVLILAFLFWPKKQKNISFDAFRT